MVHSAIINPVVLPEDLNEAEKDFVACMAAGRECVRTCQKSNTIRADLIRFFAWGGDKHAPIRGNIIDLQGAQVSGTLNLENVPFGYALALTACRFDSPVKMAYSKFRVVNLDYSYLMGGLSGNGMQIGVDMFMSHVIVAKDGVNLHGANIGGSLYCRGSQFTHNKGYALIADGLKIRGDLYMVKKFCAEGGVRLPFATIGGGLHLSGGVFNNKDDYAVIASGARIGGDVFMSVDKKKRRFCANGGVDLVGTDIAGDLVCRGGKFVKNINKNVFAADGVKVGGSLSMNGDDDNSFHADGGVGLVAARIGINWNCKGGEFNDGVFAESAKIGNSLFWLDVSGEGKCILSFASADVFDYDEKSLRGFEFILDGFSYKRFAKRKSPAFRLKWLNKRPPGVGFSPQPFEQVAKVLFAMGHNNDARKVLLEKERQLTKQKTFWRKPWRWLWDAFAGYGYQPWKTLIGIVAFVAAGAWIFNHADESHRIVPHQPVVVKMLQDRKAKQQKDECADIRRPTEVVECLLPEHPKFYPLAYSLDVFIPLFALHQEPYWYPQPLNSDGRIVRWALMGWYWLEIIAGWLLTSLFVLTITGLLKPRQSSLE